MRSREITRRQAVRLLALLGLGGTSVAVYGCGKKGRAMKKQLPPLPANVNGCVLDPERLAPLLECMQSCGPESPTDEWDHSCIHPHTGAYSCGRLAIPGGPN